MTKVMPHAGGGDPARTHSGPTARTTMHHLGCLDFELRPHPLPMGMCTSLNPYALNFLLEPKPQTDTLEAEFEQLLNEKGPITLEIDVPALLKNPSGLPWPAFDGEQAKAWAHMSDKMDAARDSAHITATALGAIRQPDGIASAAWNDVYLRLMEEAEYRELCGERFATLRQFVQDVFIAGGGLVTTAARLIQLEDSQPMNLMVSGLFKGVSAAVDAVGGPGSGVVSGGLNIVFQMMQSEQGPEQQTLISAVTAADESFRTLYMKLVEMIDTTKDGVFKDYGKLQAMALAIKQHKTPEPEGKQLAALREAAIDALELQVWKALLQSRWHHITCNDDPTFFKSYGAAQAAAFEAAQPHYWVEWGPGTQTDSMGKRRNGILVTYHWLGFHPNTLSLHNVPSVEMCHHLWSKLKLQRKSLFTDRSWKLETEQLAASSGAGYAAGP